MEIFVLERVHRRHPEIEMRDVLTAFASIEVDAQRDNGSWIAIGLDGRGRDIELVYRVHEGRVLIYHAFTTPTKKIINEIRALRGA